MVLRLLSVAQSVVFVVVLSQLTCGMHGRAYQNSTSLKSVSFSGPCPPGYYGEACANQCPSPCAQACNAHGLCLNCSVIGVELPGCSKECNTGSYGLHCSLSCSSWCLDQDCDARSGDCKICSRPGFRRPSCNIPCLPGTFGLHCERRCPLVCGESCEPIKGDCTKCRYGEGPRCTVNCAMSESETACRLYCPSECLSWCNTSDGSCSMCSPGYQPPSCQQPCKEGFYGSRCEEKCSERCKNSTCDPFSGICQSCDVGYVGRRCNGQCIPGWYGKDCLLPCPETCALSLCHFATGNCAKCLPGYTGLLCEHLCQEGRHGENCSLSCPPACMGKCDPATGVCWQCSPGKAGVFCNQTCRNGTFGPSCEELCPDHCLDDVCDSVTGQCPACKDEYKGPFCKEVSASTRSEPKNVKVIVYVLFGLLVPTISLGLAIVCYRRKIKSDMIRFRSFSRKYETFNHGASDHKHTKEVSARSPLNDSKVSGVGVHRLVVPTRNEQHLYTSQNLLHTSAGSNVKKDSRRRSKFLHFEGRFKCLNKTAAEPKGNVEGLTKKVGIEAVLSELKQKQRDNTGKQRCAMPDHVTQTSFTSAPGLVGAPVSITAFPPDDSVLPDKESPFPVVSEQEIPSEFEVSNVAKTKDYKASACLGDVYQQQTSTCKHTQVHMQERHFTTRSGHAFQGAVLPKATTHPRLAMSDMLDVPGVTTTVSTSYSHVGPLSHPAMRLHTPSELILTQSIHQYSPSERLSSVDTLRNIPSTEFSQKTLTDQQEYPQCKQYDIVSDQRDLSSSTTIPSTGFRTDIGSTEPIAVSQRHLGLHCTATLASTAGSFTPAAIPAQHLRAMSSSVTGERSKCQDGLLNLQSLTCRALSRECPDSVVEEHVISESIDNSEKCQTCSTKSLERNKQSKVKGCAHRDDHPLRKTESSIEKTDHISDIPSHRFVVYPVGKHERFSASNDGHPLVAPDLNHGLVDPSLQAVGHHIDGAQWHLAMSTSSNFAPGSGPSSPRSVTSVVGKAVKKHVTNLRVKPPLSLMPTAPNSSHRQRKVYSDSSPPKSVESGTGQNSGECVTEDDFSEGLEIFPRDKESEAAQVGSLANLISVECFVKHPRHSVSGIMPSTSWVYKADSLSPMLMRCPTTRQLSPMHARRSTPPLTARLQPLPTPPPEGKSALRPVKRRSVSSMQSEESLHFHRKPDAEDK